jgi:replicative DNA helicase
LTVLDIRPRGRYLETARCVGVMVIDYLQLLQPSRRRDNRTQEVTDISRELKVFAKELDVPVIALAQLNREVERRSPPVPMLADLRESGAIEQDADVILFIARPDTAEANGHDHTAELLIAKQRNGPTGKVGLAFHATYARFDPLALG